MLSLFDIVGILSLTLTIALVLARMLIFYADMNTHKYMTQRTCPVWDYGTFDRFLLEFHKHKWEHTSRWPKSLFDYPRKSELHAGIIRFNDRGMVLTGLHYYKYRKFMRKYFKDNKVSNHKNIWSLHVVPRSKNFN